MAKKTVKQKELLVAMKKLMASARVKANKMTASERKSWEQLWATARENLLFGDKVKTPFEQIPTVFKAIKAIADNVTQAELIFKDWDTEKEVFPKEWITLLDRPNPLMTGLDFVQALAGYMALYGEIFILKTLSKGQQAGTSTIPAELWPVNPEKMTETTNKDGMLTGWKLGAKPFKLEEVIHVKDFNPSSLIRGLAPTKPIEKIIDIDWQSLLYSKAFFENDATPGFALVSEKSLTKDQREQVKTWLNMNYRGASKAYKAVVFENGLKPEKLSMTPKDMDFIEQKRFTREEMLGIWRVPKALFNITEDLNYATFIGQMKIFWHYGIAPILKKIETALNVFLIEPSQKKGQRIYCEFDSSNVPAFQEDFKEKVNTATALFNMGFTRNEINEKLQLGFKPAPWGDKWWINPFLVPAGEVSESVPGDAPTDPQTAKTTSSDLAELTWKAFLKKHEPLEVKLASKLKRFFFEQRARALESISTKNLKGIQTKDLRINLDWSSEDKKLKDVTRQYLLAAITDGVDFGKRIVEQEVLDQHIQMKIESFLASRSLKITQVNRTIQKNLNKSMDEVIAEGLNSGATIQEMAAEMQSRVRDVYNLANKRAQTIARTEVTGALNGGSELYYEEAGIREKKWVTAGDEHVRDSHKEINGETVQINASFSNGMDHPGGDGPAEETINCRCTLIPVVKA